MASTSHLMDASSRDAEGVASGQAGAAGSLLVVRGLRKRFGHVEALRGVDLDIKPGEIVGLVGDNGAGKSTLIKILAGALQPDAGEIALDGMPVRLRKPRDARRHGIETLYQDLALAPDLTAVENLYLGREKRSRGAAGWLGVLDDRAMRAEAPVVLSRLSDSPPSLTTPVGELSGGQRQIIAIARAAISASNLILLDEPTAALGVQQSERVDALVRDAVEAGAAAVVISHNIPELIRLADRLIVMRLGRVVGSWTSRTASTSDLVAAMTGLVSSDDEDAT